MAYTNNPNLPRVRMQAVEMVRSGRSIREVARYLGYAHNTVLNWLKRRPEYGWHGRLEIPTRSSKPNHHPRELSQEIIHRILDIRSERNQCAEIIHWRLVQEGISISISSVKRTLKRLGISKYSKWKKWHQYPPRPMPERPGMLVEIDAVHEGPPNNRVSAYALIDVNSRWAYAEPSLRVNTWNTINFVKRAKMIAPFVFQTIQTDHGSEFSKQLTKVIGHAGISHRHSRVRTPTDNGHVERFIRTLQDECLHRIPRDFGIWQKEIPEFIRYYNEERPHMGLEMKTPLEVVTSY
ncbi:MAG: integrase core domain-containing protein [Patescibacteria group bacterium]